MSINFSNESVLQKKKEKKTHNVKRKTYFKPLLPFANI